MVKPSTTSALLRGSTRPNFLLSLPDELLNLILQHLSAREQLSAAIVCTSLQSAVDEIVAVGELSVAESDACSDRQLLWLSRSYRGRLCLLDVMAALPPRRWRSRRQPGATRG